MRKGVKIALWTILPLAIIIVCIVRWQAWFGMPAEPEWTGDTLSGQFITFVDDSVPGFIYTPEGWQDTCQREQLDILVLGDIHSGFLREDYDLLAERVPQAEVLAQVGDWLDRGQEYYRQSLLREWNDCGLSRLPIVNCPGNHEYSKGLNKQLSSVWHDMFPQPDNGPHTVPGASYYVDFPNLRFIVIDTNPLDHIVYLTRTLTWLRQLMYSAGDRFIVVMMHHPVIPAGESRFCPMIYTTFHHALCEADLVIAGHDHSYVRRMPFVVLNSAGRPKPQRSATHYEQSSPDATYMLLSVQPDHFTLRTYLMEDGSPIDSVYVKHD